MSVMRFLNLTILSVLLGASALVYAQDEKQPEEPNAQQQEEPKNQDEAKPSKPQEEAKPSKQDKQEEKTQKEEEKTQKQNEKQAEKQGQAQQQGQPGGNAHPAGKGGHIPDNAFHAHFGRSHTFRAQTVIVSGQPQFQYGGYTLEFVDAWPVGWAYTDDCYIDYIDGEYFLFDLLHPGVRIAVFVVM